MNANASSGAGGNPVKSKYNRRTKADREACFEGATPTASSLARINRSNSLLGQSALRTVGNGVF